MSKFLFWLLCLFFSQSIWGQFKVTVKAIDSETRLPITNVQVTAKDSIKEDVLLTDSMGLGIFNLVSGGYQFASFNSNYDSNYAAIQLNNDTSLLIILTKVGSLLEEVTVTGERELIKMNGDTLEHNALAYKLNEDATAEDLLKRLPGTTVENGVLKANGEEVKKVTIDGKDFFGDDVSLTIKNLPADMISTIQVYDRSSDQNSFSGLNDGTTTKAINIKTKQGLKHAKFGNITLGGGTSERYRGVTNYHSFSDTKRFSILINANSINQQNFATQDLLGVMGVQGSMPKLPGVNLSNPQQVQGMFGGAPGNISDFFVNQQGGINEVQSLGVNFNNIFGSKQRFTVGLSYFGNRVDNHTNSSVFRRYFTDDSSSFIYNEITSSSSVNINHRFNIRAEYQIDSMNQLIITPKISIQSYDQDRQTSSYTKLNEQILNSTNNTFFKESNGMSVSGSILYNHRSKNKRNSYSFELASDNNRQKNHLKNIISTTSYNDTTSNLNQSTRTKTSGDQIKISMIYTRKITPRLLLNLSYQPSLNPTETEQNVNRFDPISSEYRILDSAQSSHYSNRIIKNKFGPQVTYQRNKTSLSIGVYGLTSSFRGNQLFPKESELNKPYYACLPVLSFNQRVFKMGSIRLNYQAQAALPSLQQLQPVVDNSNANNITIGNPDLNQQINHLIQARFTNINIVNGRSLFIFGNYTFNQDYIGSSTTFVSSDTSINGYQIQPGAQITTYENLKDFQSAQLFGGFGIKIRPIKCLLNSNLSFNYSKTPLLINGSTSTTISKSTSIGVSLVSNISEAIDFTLGYNFTISSSNQQDRIERNFNGVVDAKISWILQKVMVISAEWTRTDINGQSSGYNQTIDLLGVSLAHKLGAKRNLELKISIFDLLDQNKSISRTIGINYIEDSQTEVLKRYGMISLTYKFKKFKSN